LTISVMRALVTDFATAGCTSFGLKWLQAPSEIETAISAARMPECLLALA
jgi:hypothetical protein